MTSNRWKASAVILKLKLVSFHYKQEFDPAEVPQFGLIAEEVEKVSPDLVVRDEDGKLTSVRYEAVNAILLNEFLKEHRTVEEQGRTIAELRSALASVNKRLKQQDAKIDKVNAKVELAKPQPQVVEAR